MKLFGSSLLMGTFLSPMREASVAMPAAMRLASLRALAALLDRLNIVSDCFSYDERAGKGGRRGKGQG